MLTIDVIPLRPVAADDTLFVRRIHVSQGDRALVRADRGYGLIDAGSWGPADVLNPLAITGRWIITP